MEAKNLLERDLNFAVAEEYINRFDNGESSFSEELQSVLHDRDHFAEFITDKVFRGKREPMLILASVVACLGLVCFPLFKTQMPATVMLFIVGVFSMVTGVIWAIAGDMGGRALSSTVVGVLDRAVYMGAAIQASVFGYVQQHFGWPAIFVTIGVLYIVMLILTLLARRMKMRKL